MADLTFRQELVKAGVQTLGVVLGGGLSLVTGWLLLRRQEKIKHEEQFAARLRTLEADAFFETLKALGRYHNLKVRRLIFESSSHGPPASRQEVELLQQQEADAAREFVDKQAELEFQLGEHGNTVSACFQAVGRATSTPEVDDAVARLHTELAAWSERSRRK